MLELILPSRLDGDVGNKLQTIFIRNSGGQVMKGQGDRSLVPEKTKTVEGL
jgi:hypothetical protein